jgi:hypothetical protein
MGGVTGCIFALEQNFLQRDRLFCRACEKEDKGGLRPPGG